MDIALTSKSSTIRQLVIYRPPSQTKHGKPMSVFLDEFSSLLESATNSPGSLLITGDFNIHVDNMNDSNGTKFNELLLSADLQQHVTGPTHQSSHTLDLLITLKADNIVADITHHELLSDPCRLAFEKPRASRRTVQCRDLKNADTEQLSMHIAVHADTLTHLNVDTCVDIYNKILRQALDDQAPSKTRIVTHRPHAPWYTDDLRREKVKGHFLDRIRKKTGLEVHRQMYNEHHRQHIRHIKQAKKEHHCNKIQNSDQKTLFRTVDGLLKDHSSKSLPHHTDKKLLSEQFSAYFADRIDKIIDGFAEDTGIYVRDNQNACASTLTDFVMLEDTALARIISKAPTKSCDFGPMPTALLKDILPSATPIIRSIVNKSLSEGRFPDSFIFALVRPLLKNPSLDMNELKNYRPISNFPFLSKVLERAVAEQLHNYLGTNDLYDRMQSAYRQNHSPEAAIIGIQNDIMTSLDSKRCVLLFMLDLSAAFDTVHHRIFLSRLQHKFGIGGKVLDWMTSYLAYRVKSVTVSGERSDSRILEYDVPQSTVFGPLLFILYSSGL